MARRKSKLEEVAPNGAVPVGDFVEEVIAARFDEDGVQVTSSIGSDGKEYPDPVPMSAPLGYEAPLGLMEMMKLMIDRLREPQNEFDIDESEEEANDFETEEDGPDPLTPYEEVFIPKVPPVVPVAALKPEVPVVASSSEPAKPAVVVAEPLKPT